jgi:hypothetical protein
MDKDPHVDMLVKEIDDLKNQLEKTKVVIAAQMKLYEHTKNLLEEQMATMENKWQRVFDQLKVSRGTPQVVSVPCHG